MVAAACKVVFRLENALWAPERLPLCKALTRFWKSLFALVLLPKGCVAEVCGLLCKSC